MALLLGCLAIFAPRVVIILVLIFSDYIGNAYETWIWPLLGFFFLPLTTLAYAWAINSTGEVKGLHLVVVIIAVLVDLGMLGGGGHTAQRSRTQKA